jgi:hypothetical protein
MNLNQIFASAILALPLLLTGPAEAATQCVALPDGLEYRAFLPDGRRFVYVDIKVLAGVFPSVFVIADKNYETPGVKLAVNDPLNQWWIDRSRPFLFSNNLVRVRWRENHTFDFVTDLFSSNDPKEIAHPIRGLDKQGDHFVGTGVIDTNTFAFQTRLEMSGFYGDYFEINVPTVTYDGVTVTPPIVKFERDDNTIIAKC